MKILFLGTMVAATLFGFSAQAEKPTFSYVLAGSPSGTFNSFNKELIKDLSKYYNVIAVPGQSEVKGTVVFKKINGPAYVMVRSGMLNAKQSIKDKTPVISDIKPSSMVMGIGYYKTLCVKAGKSVDKVLLSNGSGVKIAFSDGVSVSTKFLDNLNRVTGSDNTMVPYKGSGASVQGVIIGETEGVMVTEAKTPKYTSKGQISCKYSTNSNSKNSLSSKLKDSWFGWSYGNLAFGHTKNMSVEESTLLHKLITEILADPTTHAGAKARKNMWDIKNVSQSDLYSMYGKSKEDTVNLLD